MIAQIRETEQDGERESDEEYEKARDQGRKRDDTDVSRHILLKYRDENINGIAYHS